MEITKDDNHQEDVSILIDRLSIEKKGIVHIGAHKGQEVEQYLAAGFKKIMLIEANPEWVDYLNEKFAGRDEIVVLPYAIADQTGKLTFHIHTSQSGSTEPASILQMKEFNKIVKTLKTVRSIEVDAVRLEDVFNGEYDISDYNVMNVDVQGAELHVFKGSASILSQFDAIISEVNLVELYEGAALEEEIVDFLATHDFDKEKCVYHELYNDEGSFRAWGECLFLKQKA